MPASNLYYKHRKMRNSNTKSNSIKKSDSIRREAVEAVGWPTAHESVKEQRKILDGVRREGLDSELEKINLRRCEP